MKKTAYTLAFLLASSCKYYGALAEEEMEYDVQPEGVVTSSKLQIHVSSSIARV